MSTTTLYSSNDNQNQTTFESIKHIDQDQNEFWYAWELQIALGYKNWRDFSNIVDKAKIACEESNNPIKSNFEGVHKIVNTGISSKPIEDYQLSRYACYLVAMNGDSRKTQIALAQSYFASQTRKQELMEEFLQGQTPNLNHANSPSLKGWQSQTDGVVLKSNQFPYNPKLKERAKQLRKAGNLSEVILWNNIKNKKL